MLLALVCRTPISVVERWRRTSAVTQDVGGQAEEDSQGERACSRSRSRVWPLGDEV